MIDTFADTPHECHSLMVGFVNGLSEGSKFTCEQKYKDEEQYYAFGWSAGEIVDRIMNKNPDDSKQALAQFLGIIIKYVIIGFFSVGITGLLT